MLALTRVSCEPARVIKLYKHVVTCGEMCRLTDAMGFGKPRYFEDKA